MQIFQLEAADLARAVRDVDRLKNPGLLPAKRADRRAAYRVIAKKLLMRHVLDGSIHKDDIGELDDWINRHF